MTKYAGRTLLLIWHMVYPLLIYQVLVELVFAGYSQVKGAVPAEMVLPLTAAGALLAVIPLGHSYYQLRETDRMEISADKSCRQLPVTASVFLWCTIAGAAASLCFNNLLVLIPIQEERAGEALALLNSPAFFMQVICTVLILPLTEELVFRGIGYWRLRKTLPFLWAVFFSAIYFGLYHGNFTQGIYACLLGVLLAFLFEWTSSLFAVWCFHGAANLISIIVNTMAWDRGIFEYTAVKMAIFTVSGSLLAVSFYKIREDGRKREITIHSNSLL